MESIFSAVMPCRPPAPYLGGKRNLAKRIVSRIAAVPHRTYVEPFVGMGGVFFRRSRKPASEVINDLSGDVANFFRVLQRHHAPFVDLLGYQIYSRAHFGRMVATAPESLTDIERAVRFFYLQKIAFGGKRIGQTFGVSVGNSGRFNASKVAAQLLDIHERLSGVVIECLPYGDLIERYDRDCTLFYLDPPYWGGENDYGKSMFERADFERLAKQLSAIGGRFILSINDVPEIREIFDGFHIEAVTTTYSVGSENAKSADELIISDSKIDVEAGAGVHQRSLL